MRLRANDLPKADPRWPRHSIAPVGWAGDLGASYTYLGMLRLMQGDARSADEPAEIKPLRSHLPESLCRLLCCITGARKLDRGSRTSKGPWILRPCHRVGHQMAA